MLYSGVHYTCARCVITRNGGLNLDGNLDSMLYLLMCTICCIVYRVYKYAQAAWLSQLNESLTWTKTCTCNILYVLCNSMHLHTVLTRNESLNLNEKSDIYLCVHAPLSQGMKFGLDESFKNDMVYVVYVNALFSQGKTKTWTVFVVNVCPRVLTRYEKSGLDEKLDKLVVCMRCSVYQIFYNRSFGGAPSPKIRLYDLRNGCCFHILEIM